MVVCFLDVLGNVVMEGYDFITPNGAGGWLTMAADSVDAAGDRVGGLMVMDAAGAVRDTGFRIGGWDSVCHPVRCGLADPAGKPVRRRGKKAKLSPKG